MPIKLFVKDSQDAILFSWEGQSSQSQTIKTPWIQRKQPQRLIVFDGLTLHDIELINSVDRAGRPILIAKDKLEHCSLFILISHGTDSTRPSYRGTIKLSPCQVAA